MSRLNFRFALGAACVALALAGCGGDGGRGIGDVGAGSSGSPASDIPQSALSSTDSLLAYLNTVIATMTNETSEPLVVGDAVLPVSDTAEPGG